MMSNSIDNNLLEMVRLSLWGKGNPTVSDALFEEMRLHTITALPGSVLLSLDVPKDLMLSWKKAILRQVAFNATYESVQACLPVQVPYVILKGTTAAKYYPHPEYRAQGDIDIMTRREDFEHACRELEENGWKETTSEQDQKRGRHRSFQKGSIIVENHAFFASMNDPVKAKVFDDLIIENITENHILPDLINGLVLIDHVNQHLEEGIGLRQIIDWMMFVDKCLNNDANWAGFEKIAEQTGLKTLAVTTTRMCEIFLGLSEHDWCSRVNKELYSNLMDYIMKSGNFGNKKSEEEELAINRMKRLRHPVETIRELQKMGRANWKAGNSFFLRRFSWIWQGIHFLKDTPEYREGYKQARRLSEMFDALGVKRTGDGLVCYIDGEYVKK